MNHDTADQDGKPSVRESFSDWISMYFKMAVLTSQWTAFDYIRVAYHCLVMAISCFSGWIMFSKTFNDFSINTDVLLHTMLVGHTLFVYHVYLLNKNKLFVIETAMRTRFHNFDSKFNLENHRKLWDDADKFSLNLMKFGSYSCIFLQLFFIFNAKPFSSGRKLLYPFWVPFSLHHDISYFLTIGLQLSVFCLYWFVHVSGCGICIGGAHFIGASFEVLGKLFEDLCHEEDTRNEPRSRLRHDSDETMAKENVKRWVECHHSVLR